MGATLHSGSATTTATAVNNVYEQLNHLPESFRFSVLNAISLIIMWHFRSIHGFRFIPFTQLLS